eukprot:scpid79958/ scgid26609/ 
MAEKSRRSAVWDFGIEKTADNVATCTRCKPPKDLADHGGTTNLRNHLKDVHHVDLDGAGAIPKKDGGITAFFKAKKVPAARSSEALDATTDWWNLCAEIFGL